MKKQLSISEIQSSEWPKLLKDTLGDNLVSAFLQGDCLMEGHDAINAPWTISFILKDNSIEKLKKLQELLPKAQKANMEFLYFFTQEEINASGDVFPLEYLHLVNRNQVIVGEQPLSNFTPDMNNLRLECERELRGLMIHLRQAYIYIKEDRNPLAFFVRANATMLPVMYGVHYLLNKTYPNSHEEIYSKYPALRAPQSFKDKELFLKNVKLYIETVTKIINIVDTLEV